MRPTVSFSSTRMRIFISIIKNTCSPIILYNDPFPALVLVPLVVVLLLAVLAAAGTPLAVVPPAELLGIKRTQHRELVPVQCVGTQQRILTHQ